MTEELGSTLANRRKQAFPTLSPRDIDRLRRFGDLRAYTDCERLFAAGEEGLGMFVLLSGTVRVTRRDGLGGDVHVVDQGPVEALLIPPDGIRALILRRVILIEQGSGAVLVGHADAPDTVRLAGFLTRNGHPHRVVSPTATTRSRPRWSPATRRTGPTCRWCCAPTATCSPTPARASWRASSA